MKVNEWIKKGAIQMDGLLRSHHGRIVAAVKLCQPLTKQAHGPVHVSKKLTQRNMEEL